MPDNKPQQTQRPEGSQGVKDREPTQRDLGQTTDQRQPRPNDIGGRQGMQQSDHRRDDANSTRREGQTTGKPGNSDDEGDRENADVEPIRSGDAAVPGDPAIKHDDDAAGSAPEKRGSPPKFPREVQPRSK